MILLSVETAHFIIQGEGRFGALGHGDMEERTRPTRVENLGGIQMKQVAVGGRHSALLSQAGVVYTAGCGVEGQVCHKTPTSP
jgi:E3 ubiquitin-protein ligase HERC2